MKKKRATLPAQFRSADSDYDKFSIAVAGRQERDLVQYCRMFLIQPSGSQSDPKLERDLLDAFKFELAFSAQTGLVDGLRELVRFIKGFKRETPQDPVRAWVTLAKSMRPGLTRVELQKFLWRIGVTVEPRTLERACKDAGYPLKRVIGRPRKNYPQTVARRLA